MIETLLAKVKASDIIPEPFPHLVIKDPLDKVLCERLITEMPSLDVLTEKEKYISNQRFSYSAVKGIDNARISPLWRKWVALHTSQLFLDQIVALFGEQILANYPQFESEVGPLNALRAGIRKKNNFQQSEVLLDAQICVNTPVVGKPTSVRRGHVDLPDKLFAGLYYLRPDTDDSRGGDFEIYRFKDQDYQFKGQFIDDSYIETVKIIPYEKNVFVFFLNTDHSLHGVTVRSVTKHPRFFLNLVGEVRKPLFTLKSDEQTVHADY